MGITLSKNSGVIPLGRETLVHFQTLALNMMAEIAPMLELEGSGDLEKGGLLFSQRRWRENSHAQEAPSAYNDQAPGMGVSDDKRFSEPPDIYDYDPWKCSDRLSMLLQFQCNAYNPTVLLLMPGAIFAVCILFLIGESSSQSRQFRNANTYSLSVIPICRSCGRDFFYGSHPIKPPGTRYEIRPSTRTLHPTGEHTTCPIYYYGDEGGSRERH
jgi:hypothetical protein